MRPGEDPLRPFWTYSSGSRIYYHASLFSRLRSSSDIRLIDIDDLPNL
jgi:hypothetical protein